MVARGLSDASDLWRALEVFRPRPSARHLDWAVAHVRNETGRPYDHDRYPHQGAPGGPLDALDSTLTRYVVLQWGVRLGKTFSGQVALLKAADEAPGPMMWATSQQKLAKEGMEKFLDLIDHSRLARLLGKPRHLQRLDMVTLRANKLFLAWSRSASTLADKNIRYGHANEIDKWEHATTSTEGDPLDLFLDRFNDFLPVMRVVLESTPAVRGSSRVERWRLSGSNCRYEVPCPWCREYQALEFGGEDTQHGIKWDRGPDGKSDPDVAARTARYVCRHCGKGIDNGPRAWMMQRGVWCPEGFSVDAAAALRATASTDRPRFTGWQSAEWIRPDNAQSKAPSDEIYSSRLPSWYSLAIPSWGYFAARFVRLRGRKAGIQVFRNQVMAETWETVARAGTWEQVGKRLIDGNRPRGVVPDGWLGLVCGIDKQGDEYKWVVDAYLPRRCVHTVDYGRIDDGPGCDEKIRELLTRSWACESGPSPVIQFSLIDCGFKSGLVYATVRDLRARGIKVHPCRGSSAPLDSYATLRALGKKSSSPGTQVLFIDSASTQDLIDRQLYESEPGQPGSRTLCAGTLEEHQDFLEEIINDGPAPVLDGSGNAREKWVRRDEGTPNDWRDGLRYAFAAYLRIGRRDWMDDERRARKEAAKQARETREVAPPPVSRGRNPYAAVTPPRGR